MKKSLSERVGSKFKGEKRRCKMPIPDTVLVAIISLCGTLIGTFSGIITTNRLTNYRIEQLEKKVEKHNNLIERVFRVEERCSKIETRLEEQP
jgi:cell division protein FtsB